MRLLLGRDSGAARPGNLVGLVTTEDRAQMVTCALLLAKISRAEALRRLPVIATTPRGLRTWPRDHPLVLTINVGMNLRAFD